MTGPINARTDPETGLRFYTWNGREYPSVTSIRKLVGMPYPLHWYALNKVVDRAITDHDLIGQMLNRERRKYERVRDKNVITEVGKHLRAAATEERDAAGDRGDRAHMAIAAGLTPDQVDPDIFGHTVQFYDFMRENRAIMLWQEQQVWNLTYGYAGSADALMLFPPGTKVNKTDANRIICVDYKTSRGVYLDHAIQLVAYGMAEFVGMHSKMNEEASRLLLQADGLGILHLSESAWEWIEVRPDADIFRAFVGALAFAKFLHAKGNILDPIVTNRVRGGTLVPALAASLRLIPGTANNGENQ